MNLNDWMPRAKSEAILARACAEAGFTPVVLTSRKATWTKRYFSACGVVEFKEIEHLLEDVDRISDEEVDRILQKCPTFQDLLRYESDGVCVGKHVLSTAVRHLQCGTVDLGDPRMKAKVRATLRDSLAAAKAGRKFFAECTPAAAIWNERGYTPYAELFDVAILCGINTIQYVHAQRTDALVFRRNTTANRDLHAFSLSAESWTQICKMPWLQKHENQVLETLSESYRNGTWCNYGPPSLPKPVVSRKKLQELLQIDPSKKTAVIFSHVLWDATFFYGRNLFPDYEQWLIATVRAACKNTAVNWLIKLHPDYVWKMRQRGDKRDPRDVFALKTSVGTLPPHMHIMPSNVDINTYSLFSIMDFCITVRGTIGIEAPCFGIPVLTAGTGRYSGKGFTKDFKSSAEYLECIRHLEQIPRLSEEETALARRHAYALFHLRPLIFHSFSWEQKRGVRSSLKGQNTVIRVHTPQELADAADLRRFIHWVFESRDEDFLALPHKA